MVELRCFGGLSVEQTGEYLDISPATVKRYWSFARAWLFHRLSKAPHGLDSRGKASHALLVLKSTISSKGQVTVPAEVRERLGLDAGTVVLFAIRKDGALLRKGTLGEHPVDKVFGILKPRRPVDSLALLDQMRGPRPGGPRGKAR